jgi:glycosyltransferase involved in cell wall biosynthesis
MTIATRLAKSDVAGAPIEAFRTVALKPQSDIEAALLTGGLDRPYAFGLAMALASQGITLDVIGSDEVDSPELHSAPNVNFLNLRGRKGVGAGPVPKAARVLMYYARLIRYAATARPEIFHILWNNKFQFFDRILLMSYYKALGKRIALTVHNVNAGVRDSSDSLWNRLTLRMQYSLADHLFVHTEKMKGELIDEFGVRDSAISVIPFGINNSVPDTKLSPKDAKQQLGIKSTERVILFFGAIRPYKGLEHLVEAFKSLDTNRSEYRLIIAGEPKRGTEHYLSKIHESLKDEVRRGRVTEKIEFIPDEETELYFKAADLLVLPYTHIFQSGVLLLAYSFGLPVVATDVGSFGEDIVAGKTGFLCKPRDPVELAKTIEKYFESDLYKDLGYRRQEIREYARAGYSWDVVGEITKGIYTELIGRRSMMLRLRGGNAW